MAEPRPTLEQVSQRVDALNAQVDVAVEDFANSKIALATAARKSALAQGRVQAAQAELDAVRTSMSSMAAAAYRSGGVDQMVSLVNTSTPQTFLDRAGALDRIAARQSAQLAAAQTARHRLAQVQSDAANARAAQEAVASAMAAQQQRIEGALAQEQQLLSSLKAEERARLEAIRQAEIARAAEVARAEARASRSRQLAAEHAAAEQALAQAQAARSHSTARTQAAAAPAADGSSNGGSYNGPASGRAGVAVQAAYAQLGKPYRWGASGPGSFDCSGLTAWAWGKAGVSLSHSSQAQRGEGQQVSQADVRPGDLVFFGSPIHHVGIYIGDGNMISAPHTGDVVKIQPAFRSDYVGATRP